MRREDVDVKIKFNLNDTQGLLRKTLLGLKACFTNENSNYKLLRKLSKKQLTQGLPLLERSLAMTA